MPSATTLPLTGPASERGGVLSIGNFDGVHLGHQSIIHELTAQARSLGAPALVMTFVPHPLQLLRPEAVPQRLTTSTEKIRLLKQWGVDAVIEFPTSWDLLRLTAREFFDQLILGRFDARGLVEGPNFHFGQQRGGDVALLRQFCEAAGRTLTVVAPLELDGEIVSSSRIRRELSAGHVEAAARLLGRPHRVQGSVTSGAQRGRALGFPTANLAGVETLLPAAGVYACRALFNGQTAPAAVNIGGNPTFGESSSKIEAHLLDFSGDLYSAELTLEFISWLRGIETWNSAHDLQRQLERDIAAARAAVE